MTTARIALHRGNPAAWTRHHPQANTIALELLRQRDLLGLRSGRLVKDVCDVFHVGACTARIAVSLARRNGRFA